MKQSEFDNFNTLNLEDRFIPFNEVGGIEPMIFKKRIQKILSNALKKVQDKSISNISRSLLFQVLTEGNKAMRDGSHKALVEFYYNAYRDAITEGNQPQFAESGEWDWIVDNKSTQSTTALLNSVETDIRKLKGDQLTNQFNQKAQGLAGFSGDETSNELSLTWKIAIVGLLGYGAWFWHKKNAKF
jgi:hypothetical protein